MTKKQGRNFLHGPKLVYWDARSNTRNTRQWRVLQCAGGTMNRGPHYKGIHVNEDIKLQKYLLTLLCVRNMWSTMGPVVVPALESTKAKIRHLHKIFTLMPSSSSCGIPQIHKRYSGYRVTEAKMTLVRRKRHYQHAGYMYVSYDLNTWFH
jgi:hypothetical protein